LQDKENVIIGKNKYSPF